MQSSKPQPKTQNDLKYRCYHFSIAIIKYSKTLPNERIYWTIVDQLLRCSTSIGANIVEAKASHSKKDFIKFFEISLKSANETKYWLGLLRDATDADKEKINTLLKENNEISNIIGASLLTMKNRK